MEHGGKVSDGREVVAAILEDETKVGKGDSDCASCCGRTVSTIVFGSEVVLAY